MDNNTATFTLGDALTVKRMGFGAMRITGPGIWGMPENKSEAIKVLQEAVAMGVNFIDTADSYGPEVSEELIAKALYPYPKGLVIATKGGFMRTGPNQWYINSHPDHLKRALEGSLNRLKLESIALYQLHRIDPNCPFEQSLEFLQDAQEEGLIQHIGLSEVSVADIEKAQEYVNIVSVQNKYSIVYRNWEKELKHCKDNNIAFIPWNPINAGNISTTELMNRIAAKHNTTPHVVALSWLYHHSPNILLIPGTSKVAHLKENMESIHLKLSDTDIEDLNNIA